MELLERDGHEKVDVPTRAPVRGIPEKAARPGADVMHGEAVHIHSDAGSAVEDHTWEAEIDCSTPSEWSRMLDLFEDANLYQTWSYGKVRWGEKNLSQIVLRRGGEVLAMAQLRIIRVPPFKLGMAYLRWGPLVLRRGKPIDPGVFLSMARALEKEYVKKRRLLLCILPNAIAGSQRSAMIASAFRGFTPNSIGAADRYRTFILDLAPPLEELRKRLDKKWRNLLTNAEKKGLMVRAGRGIKEFEDFCLMYRQMRKRKAFETTVDIDEFARIQQDLPERHRMLVLICEDEGVPVAGLVASAMGDTAIYLLGATSDAGLNSRGAYLLQWTFIKWLKENGFAWYDLGGINPEGNPGVYHFKEGLSGADVSHIPPLTACANVLSSVAVWAGVTMRRRIMRNSRGALGC